MFWAKTSSYEILKSFTYISYWGYTMSNVLCMWFEWAGVWKSPDFQLVRGRVNLKIYLSAINYHLPKLCVSWLNTLQDHRKNNVNNNNSSLLIEWHSNKQNISWTLAPRNLRMPQKCGYHLQTLAKLCD